jgi:nucleotide-binding universal stress UspA family protein
MTTGSRLLVCVDSSRAALQAARLAIDLAAAHGGPVRAISVTQDGATARRLDARGRHHRPATERLTQGARAVLDRIVSLGAARGVPVETALLVGEPLRAILREAEDWGPDLVLIGRTGRSGPGSPMVGSLAMHLVEFTEWPVVIVPEPAGT